MPSLIFWEIFLICLYPNNFPLKYWLLFHSWFSLLVSLFENTFACNLSSSSLFPVKGTEWREKLLYREECLGTKFVGGQSTIFVLWWCYGWKRETPKPGGLSPQPQFLSYRKRWIQVRDNTYWASEVASLCMKRIWAQSCKQAPG